MSGQISAGLTCPADGDAGSAPGLRRSWELFQAFRVEQTNPDHFYVHLAEDAAAQVRRFTNVEGQIVLDIGGGPGYFAESFRSAGASYIPLEYDFRELCARSAIDKAALIGDGMQLPVKSGSVDVAYSSNVIEHVPRPWQMADEMIRVLRPGGTAFLSFTNWLSPFGGHETAPWHYFGGHFAAERYEKRTGRPPKNRFGSSLFPVSVADALAWADKLTKAKLIAAQPRYYPDWARVVLRVPGLREIATWNLLLVLQKTPTTAGSEA